MSSKIHTDDWVDVVEMATKFPDKFEKPSDQELDSVSVNASVKIGNGRERFFVTVKNILPDGSIIGTVDNHLIRDSPYNFGDTVKFEKKNIYVVHTRDYFTTRVKEMMEGKSNEEVMDIYLRHILNINLGLGNITTIPANINRQY